MLFYLSASLAHAAPELDKPSCALYPESAPPESHVFKEILAGLNAAVQQTARCSFGISASDTDKLKAYLRERSPAVVITLGHVATSLYENTKLGIPYIVGGDNISPSDDTARYGIGIAPDPRTLLTKLRTLSTTTRRLYTVYERGREEWLIEELKRAARPYQIQTVADPASNVIEASPRLGDFIRNANPDTDAIWLGSSTLTGSPELVAYLVKEAWSHHVLLISSTLEDAKWGVLMAAYPDFRALGQRLGELSTLLRSSPNTKIGVSPMKTLKFAVNLRTARHLGLREPSQGEFDLLFQEAGGP